MHQEAGTLNLSPHSNPLSDWEPEILFNSFASEELFDIGEDVVFQMLLKAWCQHRPVSLSPDDWFWKDIVKKSRPRTIQGPACGRQRKPLSRFDGWFVRTVNQHDSKQ